MILWNQLLHGNDSLSALIYGVGVGMDNFIKHIHFVALSKCASDTFLVRLACASATALLFFASCVLLRIASLYEVKALTAQ